MNVHISSISVLQTSNCSKKGQQTSGVQTKVKETVVKFKLTL